MGGTGQGAGAPRWGEPPPRAWGGGAATGNSTIDEAAAPSAAPAPSAADETSQEGGERPYNHVVQMLNAGGYWRVYSPILPGGLVLGRSKGSAEFPHLGSLAVQHLRLGYESGQLFAEDLGSVNGVYLKIGGPTELEEGSRFRIGEHVLEFRRGGPVAPVAPRCDDGEAFWSRDVVALGFVDLIRPDDQPGLRFPLTKADGTVIGREGSRADIALVGDNWVSACHARITAQAGRFELEDLRSRNGTYVRIGRRTALNAGSLLMVGRVHLRIVDGGSAGP